MTNFQNLLAGEQSLRDTFELAPVGMAQLDVHGLFLAANNRLCTMLGYEREELLGRTLRDITFADDVPRSQPVLNGDSAETSLDKRVVRADGSTLWTRLSVAPVRDADGRVEFVIATMEDISAQIASAEARVAAENRLERALRASRVGMFQYNVRTNTLEWESGLQRLFGPSLKPRTSSEDLLSVIHPADRARVTSAYARCIDDGADFDEEFRVIWDDGSIHWVRDRFEVVKDAAGTPQYVTGAYNDITEARRIEEELRRRDARFRTLANNIPQLAWIAERDTSRTWFNERWYGYTGQTYEQSRDFGWHNVIHPDDLDRVRTWQTAAFRAGHMWEDIVSLRRRDGQYRAFLARAVPVMDADGVVRQYFGTNTDITERHAHVRELQQVADDRQHLLDTEQRARTEAEHAIKIRDEVLAVVAHDLRNPVQTIVMSAGALTEFSLDESQRARQMDIIKRSAWRINRLIDDLLDASQMEIGQFSITRRSVHVSEIVAEVFDQFELLAANKRVTLERQLESHLPAIPGDADRLVQACGNLLANALKFTDAAAPFACAATPPG